MAEKRDSGAKVQVVMAIIGVVGTLGVAAITNWDKIWSTKSANSASPSPSPSLSPSPYYLEDHKPLFIRQANIYSDLQWGRVYWQETVWIDDDSFDHALGMHAPDNGAGFAEFSIPSGARYFQTVFGLARDDRTPNPDHYGYAMGRIYIDGRRVWESQVSGKAAVHSGAIPIPSEARVLRLEVNSLGSNWGDHTTWGDPFFSAMAPSD